jgi:ATP-dependent DNA ligase
MLKPLHTQESRFTTRLSTWTPRGVTFVEPKRVAEVRYSERTSEGRLRQPSLRGLRPDTTPTDQTSNGNSKADAGA